MECDFGIRVNDPFGHQAKDIFGRLERWRDYELPKEGLPFLLGFLEPQGANLSCGTMYLVIIIAVDFGTQDLAGVFSPLLIVK